MRKSWRSHLKRVLLLSIGLVIPFASITAFPFGRLAFPGKHNSGRRQTSALAAPLKTDRLMTRQGISRTGSSGIIRDAGRNTGEYIKPGFAWSMGTGKVALLSFPRFSASSSKGNFMVGWRVRDPCVIMGNGACGWNRGQLRGS